MLRQLLAVLTRTVKRPRLRSTDYSGFSSPATAERARLNLHRLGTSESARAFFVESPPSSNGQALRGTANGLLHNRLHDGVLKLSAHFADGGLDHHHRNDFFLGVDPEVRSVGAAPTEAAV